MYEVGKVHVWVRTSPEHSYLIGQETTVKTGIVEFVDINGKIHHGWMTDTPARGLEGYFIFAAAGELRPKNPPSGEKSIMDQFSRPINTKTPEMA